MKNLHTFSILMLFALLFATGCSKDKMEFPGPEVPQSEMGYLDLSKFALGVSTEAETVEFYKSSTRSRLPEAAPDTYYITITDIKSKIAWEGTYGTLKALTEPLALAPGLYTLKAVSAGEIAPMAWDAPAYMGKSEFTITKKQTTTVPDLICTLSNIKTTVELSADLQALFKKDDVDSPLKVNVTLQATEAENPSCDFLASQTKAAFFKPVGETNTMLITLSGLYNVNGEGLTPQYVPVNMEQTIDNVKGGQWRKIAISIEHSTDGNIQFKITVEEWVYDNLIDVNVMSKLYLFDEEEVRDAEDGESDLNSPVVTLEGGHSINNPFSVSDASFDDDLHTCIDRLSLVATPEGTAGIKQMSCRFASDNADLLTAIANAGHEKHTVELYPVNNASTYTAIRTDEQNRLLVKVNDTGMYGLRNYPGTHTVTIVTKDTENRLSFTTLTITVAKSGVVERGPNISGLYGFTPDTRYTLTPGQQMQVAINVSSKTGITDFEIEIIGGNVLSAKDLESIGLAAKMDLINPATEKMKKQLQMLGFLPSDGSGIEGKKELIFDISQFIPAMSGLGGRGDCDFKLSIGDASGSAQKTLMFTVVDAK